MIPVAIGSFIFDDNHSEWSADVDAADIGRREEDYLSSVGMIVTSDGIICIVRNVR